MTLRPASLLLPALVALLGCGGADAATGTTAAPLTTAEVRPYQMGCTLDVGAGAPDDAIAVLEESAALTGAQVRYEVTAFGEVRTGGLEMSETLIRPGADGNERAAQLFADLQDTGVYALEPGCYDEGLEDGDAQVVSLALPHRGRVLRFATRRGEGPLPLLAATRLVRDYALETAEFSRRTMRQATELDSNPDTEVTVIAP